VFVGLLARMFNSGRARLIHLSSMRRERPLTRDARFAGTSLLHFRGRRGLLGSGGIAMRLVWTRTSRVAPYPALLRRERNAHRRLGPEVVRALVRAGADVDACGGVNAGDGASYGGPAGTVEIARALLGIPVAAVNARTQR